MDLKIYDYIIPKFDYLVPAMLNMEPSEIALRGGRGSTKSTFAGLILPFLLIMDYSKGIQSHAIAIRKVGNTLKKSVYNQTLKAISMLGWDDLFKCTVSPMEIKFIPSGQTIFFSGCDDPTKIKSIAVPNGYIKYRWLEEFDQFDGEPEIRNLNQSLARGGRTIAIYTFNTPPSINHWVNKWWLDSHDKRGLIQHTSTWEMVPHEWLGDDFIYEANYLKKKNLQAYNNEYLGQITGIGGEIFTNVKNVTLSDDTILTFDKIRQGLDFGLRRDPSAFEKLCYSRKHSQVWFFDEIFGYGYTNRVLADLVREKAIYNQIIKGDSAELRSINTMSTDYNINMIPCQKGPDSVRHGIKWFQDLESINIDRKRCPNAYREFSTYSYEKNKQGEWINEYPDKDNHTIDAARYALDDIILQSGWRVPQNDKH